MNEFTIRKAGPEDVSLIKLGIDALAEYEKLSHQVSVTTQQLSESLFKRNEAHCILAFEGEIAVGFAIYVYNYSTFLGKKGLYLEDLFVYPSYRGLGYGKRLLLTLAKIAHDENCGRMEWSVLNWNTPAIEFYTRLGAAPLNGWTTFRLDQETISALVINPS